MSLKISRILHAGYQFSTEKAQILFDPLFENPFSQNCYAFPSVNFDIEKIKNTKFDAIFISHYHDDHCSMKSLQFLNQETPIYIYCIHDEMTSLIQMLGFKKVYQLEINQQVVIGDIKVTPRQALDADVDCLFQIQSGDLNILNVVDSWIDDYTIKKLESMKPWNLIMWPFQTMRELEVLAPDRAEVSDQRIPEEWITQLQVLNPKYLIPSSCQFRMENWSWYNQTYFPISYEKFENQVSVALNKTKIIRLEPSQTRILRQDRFELSEALPWVIPVGEQSVDYCYNPNIFPPSTSEIAKNFASLSDLQKQRIDQFCEIEIMQIFDSLSTSEDPYFSETRHWELALYNHQGEKISFFYEIKSNKLLRCETVPTSISWATEIPMVKLYNALEMGESLTSLYIRINKSKFSDLLEDVLLRCLFNGKFASYQKAQLRSLSKC